MNDPGAALVADVRRAVAAWLACALCVAGTAFAADLPDPMRPTPGGAVAAPRPTAAGPEPDAAPAPRDDGLRLLSIRRPVGGRASALFGERWVSAGERIEGWRVLAVDADEVRLQREGERIALRLWPKSLTPGADLVATTAAQRTRSAR